MLFMLDDEELGTGYLRRFGFVLLELCWTLVLAKG